MRLYKEQGFLVGKKKYNVIIEISGTTSNLRRPEEKKTIVPKLKKGLIT